MVICQGLGKIRDVIPGNQVLGKESVGVITSAAPARLSTEVAYPEAEIPIALAKQRESREGSAHQTVEIEY